MWNELEPAWQESFRQAWEAFCSGSKPIGAIVVNEKGDIVARGRNAICEKEVKHGHFCWSEIAHAELNALSQLNRQAHPGINQYTLYTTVEPCPLCFGAFYMSGVRNLKYAARDGWAGSTNLYGTTKYMQRKPIKIEGPMAELEVISIALNTYSELKGGNAGVNNLLPNWAEYCPEGVQLGKEWFESKKLDAIINKEDGIKILFDEMACELKEA